MRLWPKINLHLRLLKMAKYVCFSETQVGRSSCGFTLGQHSSFVCRLRAMSSSLSARPPGLCPEWHHPWHSLHCSAGPACNSTHPVCFIDMFHTLLPKYSLPPIQPPKPVSSNARTCGFRHLRQSVNRSQDCLPLC